MKDFVLTPDLIKKTFTYRQKKDGWITAAIIFGIFFLPMLVTLILLIDGILHSSDIEPFIFIQVVYHTGAAITFLILGTTMRSFLKNPQDYSIYNADVDDYELYSAPRGRYGSYICVRLKVSFTSDSGNLLNKVVDVQLKNTISKNSCLDFRTIKIGYDEKEDRFLIVDDLNQKFSKDGSWSDDPFNDF